MEKEIKKYFIGGAKGAGKELIKMVPGVSVLLGFLEGAEANLQYKKEERAVELLTILNENGKLSEELLKSEYFIDGLAKTLQKYLFEHSKKKRKMLANILIDFTESKEQEEFNFERYFDIILKLDSDLIILLEKISKHKIYHKDSFTPPKEGEEGYSDLKFLESIGLVVIYKWNDIINHKEYEGGDDEGYDSGNLIGYRQEMENNTDAEISRFGKEVLKYITSS